MKKLLFLVIATLLLSTLSFAQVKDYELGSSPSGRTNSQGGYFDYSEPLSINIKVSVWGFVKYPGRYFVPINTTASDLLSLAGGPTDDAHLDDLRLYRVLKDGTNELHSFSYNDILWSDNLELDKRSIPNLTASDVLVVPGSPRLYFKDWASLTLTLISVLTTLTILILRI
ncbi:MAG: SLBB domain-containing protein [Bacteroidetes bacterium]|nr:SLBB domain-containing protein [Bacteroidota bacterium]MBU1114487.1 SLBB domain-containing protein [Bacteroidota bacterium]MBU1799913.1 SLBB domain-containing protein [Bacteroidota bacterium]